MKRYISLLALGIALLATTATAAVKGIYLTQYSFENTVFLTYLIKHARAAGIDTFVIDMEKPSKIYLANLALLKENNIKYVARIIMFPGGGTPAMIKNPEYWQKRYNLVKQAIDWGASEIQLDYIRYNTLQKPSPQNAKDIQTIITWYKNKLKPQNIPLQIDVFGITSFGESKYIGQNIKSFSETVDAICPMVYPSHYEPFASHYKTPYKTVHTSLMHIKKQFDEQQMPIKVYAYIELSNYHYRMSREQKIAYVREQLRAVRNAGANGWYAWSPHNRYDNLFYVLQNPEADPVNAAKDQDESTLADTAVETEDVAEEKTKKTITKSPAMHRRVSPIPNYMRRVQAETPTAASKAAVNALPNYLTKTR